MRRCRAPSFKLSKVKIGDRNYLGNNIHFPPDGKTGTDCLLGTKVMIPIDGPVREGVGLLGSPCFEIPRAVERDKYFNTSLDERGPPAAAREEERPQHRHRGALPAGQLGVRSSPCCSSPMRRCCSYPQLWPAVAFRRRRLRLVRVDPVLRAPRAGEPGIQAAASRRSSRSTTSISGSTSGTGSSANRRCSRCSRARPSRT